MIRKLKSGEFRIYSGRPIKPANARTSAHFQPAKKQKSTNGRSSTSSGTNLVREQRERHAKR